MATCRKVENGVISTDLQAAGLQGEGQALPTVPEVLRDLGNRGKRETRRIREDLEQMRRANQELAARLSKLEERVTAEHKATRSKHK